MNQFKSESEISPPQQDRERQIDIADKAQLEHRERNKPKEPAPKDLDAFIAKIKAGPVMESEFRPKFMGMKKSAVIAMLGVPDDGGTWGISYDGKYQVANDDSRKIKTKIVFRFETDEVSYIDLY